ncbi:MAG: zinc ribbon domain-containing protein [Candidatus Omnitrophica bacterium]|nr:zinc ribbon domain-containing protein [Candidatus Omnitrophota bacterium]
MNNNYFDYQSISQEDEGLDYANLKPCPHCKKPIPANATLCLYCGESVSFDGGGRAWIVWVAVFVLLTFITLILIY